MRPPHLVAAALLLGLAGPAAAQLQDHSIAVESGLSTTLSGPAGARGAFALAATTWLDGPLEAVARVAVASVPETGGRLSAAVAGTAGVRLSLLPDPLRPQLGLEVGWARVQGASGPRDAVALGASAGLEWFPARDLSVAGRGAVRAFGSALSLELVLGAAAYF